MTISPADERDLLSGALPEALAREDLANLAVLLRYASDGCFAVAVYNDALAREQVVDALRRLVAPLPVFEWTYSKLDPYPSGYLDRLTDAQRRGRAVVFFFGLDQAGPDVIKSLDYHRERLSGHPHGLVFWVTPGFASRMACTAPHFWSQRSGVFDFTVACAAPASPADDVLQRMITDSTAWDDREERERALRLYQALLKEYEANPATPARALFDLHLRLARLLYYDDRPDEAKAHALAALELAKRLDRPRDRADALQTLGDLKRRLDDLEGARADYDAALALYRAIGNRLGEANALLSLGNMKQRLDDLEGARADYDAALALCRAIGDRLGQANALRALGDVKLRLDDLEGARADYDAALALYRAIGSRLGEANALQRLGDACLAAGEVETAHRHYAAAQAIYEQIAARRDQSRNLIRLARAEQALGRSESAVAHLVAAARLADAVQDDGLCRQALDLLAEACAATRDRRALDDLLDALIAAHLQDTELRARRGDAGQGS